MTYRELSALYVQHVRRNIKLEDDYKTASEALSKGLVEEARLFKEMCEAQRKEQSESTLSPTPETN